MSRLSSNSRRKALRKFALKSALKHFFDQHSTKCYFPISTKFPIVVKCISLTNLPEIKPVTIRVLSPEYRSVSPFGYRSVSLSKRRSVSPSKRHSSKLNISKEKQNLLLANKDAEYTIRVISRREANQLRRKGVDIHVLGAVERISPSEALAKAEKFVPLASICVKDRTIFDFKPNNATEKSDKIQYLYYKPTKITRGFPSIRLRGNRSCRIGGRSGCGSFGEIGGICGTPMSVDVTESSGGGFEIHYSYSPDPDKAVYVLEKMEKDIAEMKDAIQAINSEVKVEQSEDDNLIVRLSLYFKNEDIAKRFLNSARQMKNDKEIITLLKKYRDDGRCTGTPKALWELLAEENLYKTGYTNWNAQLNKRQTYDKH